MSLAVILKVNDGLVVGADSASSMVTQGGVVNVYDNANKICHIHRKLPIGFTACGDGSIGADSISLLVKDFRSQLEKELDVQNYCIEDVAKRTSKFLYDDHYLKIHGNSPPEKSAIQFAVFGFSSGQTFAEVWETIIVGGKCNKPTKTIDVNQASMRAFGMPQAYQRLVMGFDEIFMKRFLQDNQIPIEEIDNNILPDLRHRFDVGMINSAMPIQDAIDLVHFVLDTTIKFHRFSSGAPIVGGPIDIACITRHEQFKWVRRKFFYDQGLNPCYDNI